MRKVDFLVIQSTDTSEANDLNESHIIKQHTASAREGGYGWNRPGIDYLVLQDGSLKTIISEESPTTVDLWGISQGRDGITGNVKHIAYVGGRTLKETWWKDTRTEAQTETLETLIKFHILRHPEVIILGFNEIPSKLDADKPGFDVKEWLETLETPERNIYKSNQ